MGLYAGFWRRTAAYAIDALVLLIPGVAFALVLPGDGLAKLANLLAAWLYTALLDSGVRQATLGKRAFGIKVTGLAGERISFARASGRYFGMFVSALLVGVGFLLAGLTRRKQALHDMMAGCLVVRRDAAAAEAQAGGATMPITAGVWTVVVLLFIVPSVIGVIAAIAMPAFEEFTTVRAKVLNAVQAAGPSGEAPAESPYVRRVAGDRASGRIEIFLDAARIGSRSIEEGASIRYVHEGNAWKCSAHGVPSKFLPRGCRD